MAFLKISKRDVILLFIFVLLDQLTTFYGVFYLKLEEGNPIGKYIFENFGKYGIFLTFLHEFFLTLALFYFFRFLREKVFKTQIPSEYIAIFMPLIASIRNTYIILLNY
jgi:hypothetical protein